MRPALRWVVAAAGAVVGGCATAPPGPERLETLGPVAVIARVETSPVSRLHARPGIPDGTAADHELERTLAAVESAFETEVRFRGELIDSFGARPPFRVVPPGRVESLRGSLLVREEGPPDYRNLARAGVGGVLELAVERVELVAARGDRPSGLLIAARARFVELDRDDETWSRELVLEPRVGGPLAFDPAAPPAELEKRYLAALAAAAREVGRETALAFRQP
jgi:hypothetical protein